MPLLVHDNLASPELTFTSPGLPGGSFVAAINDRQYMQLSDRGGASNAIGDRWAEICAEELGAQQQLLQSTGEAIFANQVFRLDDVPEIAKRASRAQLQNPDFILVGEGSSGPVMWAADAKFSVDTARAKQVSAEMLANLVALDDVLATHFPGLPLIAAPRDGSFLCPDYPLTHLLLAERRGPRRATVRVDEVRYVQIEASRFLVPMGKANLSAFLAALDDFPFDSESNLLVGLYYYRLARAAFGCWQDQSMPLLSFRDSPVPADEAAIEQQARDLATSRMSAWGLLLRWNDLADFTRQQRLALDRASSPPVNGRLLRDVLEQKAAARGVVAPSTSKVRRLLGSWFRGVVREQFGPVYPPVANFEQLESDVALYSRSLTAMTEAKSLEIMEELLAEAAPLSPDECVPGS